jgi:hypothetical protein
VDAAGDAERLTRLRRFANDRGEPLYEISGVTGQGLEDLKRAVWAKLEGIPKPARVRALDTPEPAPAHPF